MAGEWGNSQVRVNKNKRELTGEQSELFKIVFILVLSLAKNIMFKEPIRFTVYDLTNWCFCLQLGGLHLNLVGPASDRDGQLLKWA